MNEEHEMSWLDRGYRAGFEGREPAPAKNAFSRAAYMRGYEAGARHQRGPAASVEGHGGIEGWGGL
jgi:hypothetical protein